MFKQFLCLLTVLIGFSAAQAQAACNTISNQNVNRLTLAYEAQGFGAGEENTMIAGRNVAWSPDSQTLSVWGTDFYVDYQENTINQRPQAFPVVAIYEPDGTPLVFGLREGDLHIWDGVTGNLIHNLNTGSEYGTAPTLSPDGTLLAFVDSNYRVQLWNMQTGERLGILEHGEYGDIYAEMLAFSPDGSFLVAGSYAETPLLWSVPSGQFLYDLEDLGVDNHISDVEFSPDRRHLVFAMHRAVVWIDMENNPLQDAHYLREFSAVTYISDMSISPDGSLLAVLGVSSNSQGEYNSYWIELWDMATRTKLDDWDSEVALRNIAFSPNGCWLAASSADYDEADEGYGFVKIWRLKD